MSIPNPSTASQADLDDPTAAERKSDHIQLAFEAQVLGKELDQRFFYEPLLAAHPAEGSLPRITWAGFDLAAPIWVSSMTGGTEKAKTINENLARACGEFGLGMGLGSCRPLLFDDERLADFNMRPFMQANTPLFANLGIAQLEQLIAKDELWRVERMLDKLAASGLIIHVNPLQEWLQPEGDRFAVPPLETIQACLDAFSFPIIVKEVGQGMGKASLLALLQLPLAAVEFAAGGGTNFAKLELLRAGEERQLTYQSLQQVGHSAEAMVGFVNELCRTDRASFACEEVIISGGVRTFLDGYYLRETCELNSVYGQASAFLKHATGSYELLQSFVISQLRGLELAQAYLRVKPS